MSSNNKGEEVKYTKEEIKILKECFPVEKSVTFGEDLIRSISERSEWTPEERMAVHGRFTPIRPYKR
jgi:hypothetical protein